MDGSKNWHERLKYINQYTFCLLVEIHKVDKDEKFWKGLKDNNIDYLKCYSPEVPKSAKGHIKFKTEEDLNTAKLLL
jgi:hypothetical protein